MPEIAYTPPEKLRNQLLATRERLGPSTRGGRGAYGACLLIKSRWKIVGGGFRQLKGWNKQKCNRITEWLICTLCVKVMKWNSKWARLSWNCTRMWWIDRNKADMEIDDPMNGNQESTINKVIIKSPRAIKRIYSLYITLYIYLLISIAFSWMPEKHDSKSNDDKLFNFTSLIIVNHSDVIRKKYTKFTIIGGVQNSLELSKIKFS